MLSKHKKISFSLLLKGLFSDSSEGDSLRLEWMDIIIFCLIYRCKVWPKIHKQYKKSNPNSAFSYLVPFFNRLHELYSDITKYQFDPKTISKKHKKYIDKVNDLKKTNKPFLNAVRNLDYDTVKEILSEEPSVIKAKCAETHKYAGHLACGKGDVRMCRLLDSFGCDWEALDSESNTPLYDAIQIQSLEVIDFLLEKGVNLDHREIQDRTPFYYACFLGNLQVNKIE